LQVAVEVQRPNVFQGAALDIFIMRRATLVFSKLPMVRPCCRGARAACGLLAAAVPCRAVPCWAAWAWAQPPQPPSRPLQNGLSHLGGRWTWHG
jgi:hypothetical protein